jgi:transposase
MSRYRAYVPEQGYLLPPSVESVLGPDHLCFFVGGMVDKLDLSRFDQSYGPVGGLLYHPSLMLKVWLYGYALGVTSSRRLEQRVREDLAFRYLSGGSTPDFWALNAFRSRHARALNDCFTQVVEHARTLGMGRLGTVAIDATRIKASASPDKVLKVERAQRAVVRKRVRRWQQACEQDDPNENAGSSVGAAVDALAVAVVPAKLPKLPRPARAKKAATDDRVSITDPEARFLRARGGRFVLGYTGEVAVSEDHLIVAQRVTREATENASLEPMVELVEVTCGCKPERVVADSGYYSNQNVERMEDRKIDAYVPDSNLAQRLNLRKPADDLPCKDPRLKRMRHKMLTDEGKAIYAQRRAIVEPVFGTLKEHRNLRSFRLRSRNKVATEFALAATAYNLTRMYAER